MFLVFLVNYLSCEKGDSETTKVMLKHILCCSFSLLSRFAIICGERESAGCSTLIVFCGALLCCFRLDCVFLDLYDVFNLFYNPISKDGNKKHIWKLETNEPFPNGSCRRD